MYVYKVKHNKVCPSCHCIENNEVVLTRVSSLGFRNVEVIGGEDVVKAARKGAGTLVEGLAATLQSEVVVQFNDYPTFCSALKKLLGKAMRKVRSYIIILTASFAIFLNAPSPLDIRASYLYFSTSYT